MCLSALFLLVYASTAFILANGQMHSVTIRSGREFAVALAGGAQILTVTTSITTADSDWEGLGELPVLIIQNVMVISTTERSTSNSWPEVNLAFVSEKVCASCL